MICQIKYGATKFHLINIFSISDWLFLPEERNFWLNQILMILGTDEKQIQASWLTLL